MSEIIDVFNFEKSPLCIKLRGGFPTEPQGTKELLECKDDILFGWDSTDSCLLALNWRAALERGIESFKYQCLIPSAIQCFVVERICVSLEGSLIALIGTNGVAILDLPKRLGPNGFYLNGKDKITCRCTNLDEHFFANNQQVEVRQVRWHPYSPNDSHLLVLTSDNKIRVYNHYTLRHVWQVGPHITQPNKSTDALMIPTEQLLGEIVVDFEIAPAIKINDGQFAETNATLNQSIKTITPNKILNQNSKTSNQSKNSSKLAKAEKVVWPIVILRQNGNIYILKATLNTNTPRLQGPLTITPQADDNYGVDSCSLTLIPSLPPTLVIAESSGKLHHALLLETEDTDNSIYESDIYDEVYQPEWSLHVLETINLELGLDTSTSESNTYKCPIHLKKDFINETRYFAYHNTGLHVITVNFINGLRDFLKSDVDTDTSLLTKQSNVEYLVCTKITTDNRVNPIIGFVQLHVPSAVLLLLGSSQIISLKLIIDANLLDDMFGSRSSGNLAKNKDNIERLTEQNFVDRIKGILAKTVTQPILSLDKSTILTPLECYELLCQATEVLETQFNSRHKCATDEIVKYVNTIVLRKQQQIEDIQNLEKEREIISENAHRLAERFEEICDKQETLSKKCHDIVRRATICLPNNLVQKTEYIEHINRINKQAQLLQKQIKIVRENMNRQSYHITKYNQNRIKKEIVLPNEHENTIKEILMDYNTEIAQQIDDIKRFSKATSL